MSSTPGEAEPLGTDPRIRLPTFADDQAFRAVLDRSFQVIADDMIDVCAESFLDQDPGWLSESASGWRDRQPRDVMFWIDELQRPQSPAYRRLGATPNMVVGELRRLRGHRNRLYHFEVEHDATSSVEVLNTVLSVARRLALPSQAELSRVRARLTEMATGRVAPVPTTQEAIDAASEVMVLRQQVGELGEVNERLNESIEDAEDRIAHLLSQVEEGTVASAQAQRAIDDLHQTEARLHQEVQVAAADLAALAAQLDALQALPPPALPLEMVDELTRVIVALNDGNHLWDYLRQANGRGNLHDPGELAAEQAVGQVLERLRSLVAVVPAQTTVVTPDSAGLVQMLAILSSMAKTLQEAIHKFRGLLNATGLDPDDEETLLPEDLELVLELLEDSVEAIKTLLPHLQRDLVKFGERLRLEFDQVADDVTDRREMRAGVPWPHSRGEDVWVLSAARRTLTRPRGRSGARFNDLVGPVVARQLISAWLEVRPEGGRVYVTPDGDACTLAPDGSGHIYLGQIPGW